MGLRLAHLGRQIGSLPVYLAASLEGIRIEGNNLRDNGTGFLIFGSRHLIRHNRAFDNDAHGFIFRIGEKLVVRDKVAESNDWRGFEFLDITNSVVRSNLADGNANRGFTFSASSQNIKLKNNLSHAPLGSASGFFIALVQDARIEGNTAVDSTGGGGDGFEFFTGPPPATFKRNNSFNNQSGCGIRTSGLPNLVYGKHFFGRSSGPDPDGPDIDNHDAACGFVDTTGSRHNTRPNAFKARAASKL